jgi:hypothetical protein
MLHRFIFYLMILLIVTTSLNRNVFSQECIGSTAYIVRDEAGRVMNLQETKKLVVKVDGVAIDQKHFTASITSAFLPNTRYVIDSLPFQEGTFHLRSLRCNDGARPPMIDNNTNGVSADNWDGLEKDWVRRLFWNESIGIRSDQSRSCRARVINIIGSQTDLAAAAESYPEIKRGGTLPPTIDFRTEIALIISTPRLSHGSIIVGKNGDLTLDQSPEVSDNNCHVFFLAVYRSGVKSIEGKPLPTASTK